MSIEVELNRKGGRICKHALAGEIHCPLIVRPTSEDVVTGNVFGMLRHIRPHIWLNPMLNQALNTDEFRQVWFKDFSLRLWERQERFPPELLEFREGRPEPDVVIEWENPATTVWIEAKWRSPIAKSSSNSENNDQITRNLRSLMYSTGQIETNQLIPLPRRRGILIALLAEQPEGPFRTGLPENSRFEVIADDNGDFSQATVGFHTWPQVMDSLASQSGRLTTTESSLANRVQAYLEYKLANRHRMNPGEDDQTDFDLD